MKKERNDKGFTLVELIVVLVILAILAAILIPALLGYIDRAKGSQDVINAKTCLTAAQTEYTAAYAKNGKANPTTVVNTADVDIYNLVVGTTIVTGDKHSAYKITYVAYQKSSSSDYLVYEESDGSWQTVSSTKFSVSTSYTTKSLVSAGTVQAEFTVPTTK